ncbi:MAG: Fic family protein, partial [Gammaproteobacteria bacterium]|nr:Fic family protein [Gammaproteobacteria bacterium]
MQRGEVGRYETTSAGGEQVRAFVPLPLPPDPTLAFDGTLQQTLEAAALALGRLDAISTLLPDEAIFLYAYVRKEAVLSSQIEGTQSTLSDLLRFELEEAPGVTVEDVVEVSNYVAALDHGLRRLNEGFPLCNRLIREIHAVLLSRGRGSGKAPGEFRRSQNWVGGTRPGDAHFVPPPPATVPDCMAALESFLHADDSTPFLIRAGLAHVQFETIHPFLDGNRRVGRLLITLLLCNAGVLRQPLLYLSLYFKQHRSDYYDLLNRVRRTGDWEEWLAFFLEGVRFTAEGAVATSRRLVDVFASDRVAIERSAGRRAGSALRVHSALESRPILSLPEVCNRTRLSFPTAAAAMQALTEQGIARELTGRPRNRLFAYDRYL